MENVLLLSCDTGQGHNSCAQAVKEYFEGRKIPCEIRDSLDLSLRDLAGSCHGDTVLCTGIFRECSAGAIGTARNIHGYLGKIQASTKY